MYNLQEKLKQLDALMRTEGVTKDPKTGKSYFTGYTYGQLYDWDQFFESIVEFYLGWDTVYPRHTVEIFLDYQDENGFSPRGVGISNGCKEQDEEMVKPFLAQIALLIYNKDGNVDFLNAEYYVKLKKYLMYWVNRAKECGNLAYWNSAVHTGMDNQHERAGYWQDNYCLGVDLNCYLARECKAFSLIAKIKGENADSAYFADFSQKIEHAIKEKMWDDNDKIFYDINKNTGEKIKVKYIGAFIPMWLNLANDEQAKYLVERYLTNEKEFKRGFLYPALSYSEKGYSESLLPTDIPYVCNWRANTWLPTNYIVFHALKNYGYTALATDLANETYNTVFAVGDREYFTTETKQGCGCDPFWGWTALAYFMPYEDEFNLDPTKIEIAKNDYVLFNKGEK